MADINWKDVMRSAASSATNSSNTSGITTGGVRIKKSQTLAGTIFGVFFGILLVLGSPVALWYAESQHTAEDFASATPVEASTATDGYVVFTGTPEVSAPLSCVEDQESCLYYLEENQELVTKQEEQCGTVSEDARIIEKTVTECDEDGNCEQCYLVERDVWETQTSDEKYTGALVGAYSVEFNESALMLGLENATIDHTETTRDVWTYFPIPDELTVAGDSVSGTVASAEKTFVLSPYDQATTLVKLEERDSTIAWILRAVTFGMLFIGFASILGPLRYFSHLLRKIPVVGMFIKEATGLAVFLASLVLAIVLFGVLWVLVTLIQNLFVLIGAVALLGAGTVVYMKLKKEPTKA